jgi:hypothetical protein
VRGGVAFGKRGGGGGADTDSEQAAGGLFGAGTRGAGEVLGTVVAADPGDENGEDDDCRGGKETGDGSKRDSERHDVTRLPSDVLPELAYAAGIIPLMCDFRMAVTVERH